MKKNNLRPIAFVTVASNHGMMLVNRHDYRTIEGKGSYGVGHQILNTGAHDQSEVDLALELLQSRRTHFGDGVVAIDCGANIGVHTIEWAQFMYGWGSVLAIEAQERLFYALAGNITMNNCFNARCLWAAVGAQSGTIKVPVPNYFAPASFGSLEIKRTQRPEFIGQSIDYEDKNAQETRLMRLDDIQTPRLDFVKIDIEGMEIEALHGAQTILQTHKPIMMIEKIKSDENALRGLLSPIGYHFFAIGINLLAVHAHDPVLARFSASGTPS